MWSNWHRRLAWLLAAITVVVAVLVAPAAGPEHIATVAETVRRMNDADRIAFLMRHPTLAVQYGNTNPEDTARTWKRTSVQDRALLERLLPQYVGNLDGIPYSTRDRANRAVLAAEITTATKRLATNPADASQQRMLHALKAIVATLGGHHSPRRYLITLTPERPPLAAIAIGNLDTADQITFAVPGMGTYTDDMQLWTQSAQNIYDAQGRVGAPKARAVVSWIGYVTPPPGIDATLGEFAAKGALRLASDLLGVTAARAKRPPDAVSVIAHSYGTTTAADALADNPSLNIYAFVMLGSAGVENRIATASDLHTRYVYAGEAAADPEARYGRLTRRDPRSPGFGAILLSVDGDPASGLLAVTGHEPILHSAWNDDPLSSAWSGIKDEQLFVEAFEAHFTRYGYLDNGTESLLNAATVTTPHATRKLDARH
ncbi:alpha/beta hydrolase [Leifsonia poae]|uniref:alpha/beta hydrolase n=1 Tax=Leifsonia poae TaxID=110933 RepID=UPI003D66D7F3